jgi:hypothetical protein
MLFWNKICGFLAIFFISALTSSAQEASGSSDLRRQITASQLSTLIIPTGNKAYLSPGKPFSIISANYYTQHFGIMCKKELALEKATKIPFRFRLGSLQQCNYLEGKKY